MQDEIVLVIGDKAWSSWSLRPWLAAKVAGIPFREVLVGLRRPDTASMIAAYSPSGRVPVLQHGPLTIWDSLAICEYFAEISKQVRLWPAASGARALARSISAEMHSGFHALRKEFSMNFHARIGGQSPSAQARSDIERAVQIWIETRKTYGAGGPFLFGDFSIADAMYVPVVTRFRTYGIDPASYGDDGTAAVYGQTILALPEMAEWGSSATRE
jgi:glutathione S-transferase